MKTPLDFWAHTQLPNLQRYVVPFDSASRSAQPVAGGTWRGISGLLATLGEERFVEFLDFVVYVSLSDDDPIQHLYDPEVAESLEELLVANGSAWRVGSRDGQPGLERRVPRGVQDAADTVMGASGEAGHLLSESWHAAFGVSPNPEEAYEKAIKAVEAAGVAVVAPGNGVATLGTMLATMRDQGNWALELADADGSLFTNLVVDMCQALWKGQPSRHGGNGYRKPTQGEAEAAVLLAVPLVQWFVSGAIARRP